MNKYWIYHYLDRYIGIPLVFLVSLFDRISLRKKNHTGCYKNILAVKLVMIGDTVLLAPSIRALRKKFGSSRLTVMCSPVNEVIVRGWDFIDGYITLDFARLLLNPLKLIKFVADLRKQKYDLVLDFETWPRIIPLITYLSGARSRIGYRTGKQCRHLLFTEAVDHTRGKHELKCFMDIVNRAGVEVEDTSIKMAVGVQEEKTAKKILDENGFIEKKFVIIHPGCGANGFYREWYPERYAAVSDYLNKRYSLKVMLTGTGDDAGIVSGMLSKTGEKVLDLSGKTTLLELIALVEKSLFVLCGNTGIVHLASAVGTPVVVLQGPTDPEKWGPWGRGRVITAENLDCRPCLYLGYEYGCRTRKCMELITVEAVKNAIDREIKALVG